MYIKLTLRKYQLMVSKCVFFTEKMMKSVILVNKKFFYQNYAFESELRFKILWEGGCVPKEYI